MDEQLKRYLTNTLPSDKEWVHELEQQANEENIPIMDKLSINLVMQLIRISKPKKILEIGTAIGYSALRMLEANPDASIVTIERDEYRYYEAVKHLNKQNKQSSIHAIFGDAIDEMIKLSKENNQFDFILIDAAKGQYKHFFELASPLLEEGGLILSDNVLFKGYVVTSEQENQKYKKIAQKIRIYNDWLVKHPDFTTSIVPIGDGIAISYKTEQKG